MSLDVASLEKVSTRLLWGEAPRDNSKIRLSSAGDCSRKIGFMLIGAPAAPDPLRTKLTFAIGHAIHAMLQRWLVDIGWNTPETLEVTLIDPEERLRGTADSITERLDDLGAPVETGVRRVVEIKTITNLPWKAPDGKVYAGAFERLEKPKDRHIDQGTAYVNLWNKAHPDDPVDRVTYLYVAKDGGDNAMPIKAFTQKTSAKRWDRLLAKFRRIWQRVDRGELPGRDYDPMNAFAPCSYCPYRGLCIEIGEDEDEPPNPVSGAAGLGGTATDGLPLLDE